MNVEQQLHDAQKTLADLRDHLARHDKPIAFLFGAGTSCAVRVPSSPENAQTQPLIPAVAGLTEMSKKDAGDLGEKFSRNERVSNDEQIGIMSTVRIVFQQPARREVRKGMGANRGLLR